MNKLVTKSVQYRAHTTANISSIRFSNRMETAVAERKTPRGRTVNYLVSTYSDLRDVVFAVEKMILEGSDIRNKPMLREGCRMTIHPLEDRTSYVVRVQLHPSVLPK